MGDVENFNMILLQNVKIQFYHVELELFDLLNVNAAAKIDLDE